MSARSAGWWWRPATALVPETETATARKSRQAAAQARIVRVLR